MVKHSCKEWLCRGRCFRFEAASHSQDFIMSTMQINSKAVFFLHHDPSPPYNPHWRFWLDCHRPYNRCFPLVFNSWSFNEVILRSTHYHTLVSNTVLAAVAENHVAMASVCAFGGCSVCGVLCDWSFLGWANVSVMKNQTGQVMFSFWTVLLGFIWESKGTPPPNATPHQNSHQISRIKPASSS